MLPGFYAFLYEESAHENFLFSNLHRDQSDGKAVYLNYILETLFSTLSRFTY